MFRSNANHSRTQTAKQLCTLHEVKVYHLMQGWCHYDKTLPPHPECGPTFHLVRRRRCTSNYSFFLPSVLPYEHTLPRVSNAALGCSCRTPAYLAISPHDTHVEVTNPSDRGLYLNRQEGGHKKSGRVKLYTHLREWTARACPYPHSAGAVETCNRAFHRFTRLEAAD